MSIIFSALGFLASLIKLVLGLKRAEPAEAVATTEDKMLADQTNAPDIAGTIDELSKGKF